MAEDGAARRFGPFPPVDLALVEITNVTVASFDGTKLAVTIFRPPHATGDHPVPVILHASYWSGQRWWSLGQDPRIPAGGGPDAFLEVGFGVVSMAQRGHGESGGVDSVFYPDVHARDMLASTTSPQSRGSRGMGRTTQWSARSEEAMPGSGRCSLRSTKLGRPASLSLATPPAHASDPPRPDCFLPAMHMASPAARVPALAAARLVEPEGRSFTMRTALFLTLLLVTPLFAGCLSPFGLFGEDRDEAPASTEPPGPLLTSAVPPCTDAGTPPAPTGAELPDGDEGVGYASSADRVLIRWITSRDGPFTVTRDGATLTTVSPNTDLSRARSTLDQTDSRFPALSTDLVSRFEPAGVESFADLLTFLRDNRYAAEMVASEHYPVALVLGTAHLDRGATPGQTYTYTVTAADGATIGSVQVVAGQPTPVPVPAELRCVDLAAGSDVRRGADAWGMADQDRLYDRAVLLSWDLPQGTQGMPPEWVAGYDVFRAAKPAGANVAVPTLPMERINVRPVQPNPAAGLVAAGGPPTGALPSNVSFYYADRPDAAGDYYYAVAPRDLLGQEPAWPLDAARFSPLVEATAHDLMPPSMPRNLTATPDASGPSITLAWEPPASGDATRYRVFRTTSFEADPPGCNDPAACWVQVASLTTPTWVDTAVTPETVYWYRIVAEDAAGNRGPFAGPTPAVVHDERPPDTLEGVSLRPGSADPIIDVTGNPDVERIRVYCSFGGGEPVLITEVEGPNAEVNLSEYFDPAVLVDVECFLVPVDANGNVGDVTAAVPVATTAGSTGIVLPPTITSIEARAGGTYSWTARIDWTVPEVPGIAGFVVVRHEAFTGDTVRFTVSDPDARTYDDTTVDFARWYDYAVTVELTDGTTATSATVRFRPFDDEIALAPVGELTWVPGYPRLDADGQPELAWRCHLCDTDTTSAPIPGEAAVFRSVSSGTGYFQLAPPEEATSYVDSTAEAGEYWYVVVEFDPSTGDVIAATEARSVDLGPAAAAEPIVGDEDAVDPGSCVSTAPDQDAPVVFGEGLTVRSVTWTSTTAGSVAGSGTLDLVAMGADRNVPVTFSGLSVEVEDGANQVCAGGAVVDLAASPVRLVEPGDLDWEFTRIELVAQGANDWARADATVGLGPEIRVVQDGVERDRLALSDITIDRDNGVYDIDWEWTFTHTCANPTLEFRLETMPVAVVPLRELDVDRDKLDLRDDTSSDGADPGACMRYIDPSGRTRPGPTTMDAADANDGFLRAVYTAASTEIRDTGIEGTFLTEEGLRWLAAAPYSFHVNLTEPFRVTIEENRITEGGTSVGTATVGDLWIHYDTIGNGTLRRTATGDLRDVQLVPGGGLVADAAMHLTIDRSQTDGFVWDLDGLEAGPFLLNPDELYLAPVTSAGLPQDAIRASLPRAAGSQDFGVVEPGLNQRATNAPFEFEGCVPREVDVTGDLDVVYRHGGASGRIILDDGGVAMPLHGYNATFRTLDVALVHNHVFSNDVTFEILLDRPVGATIPATDAKWVDGCISEANAGGAVVTLAHWDVDLTVRTIGFAPLDPPRGDQTALLTADGTLAVPSVAGPAGEGVVAHLEIRPDGSLETTRFAPAASAVSRGYRLEGFLLLLDDVRLSDVGEAPRMDPGGSAADAPAADWSTQGFVEVEGTILTPFFGALGEPGDRPRIVVLGWDEYVAFTTRPTTERSWVDLAVVDVDFTFPLVLAHGPEADDGRFVGFRTITFPPSASVDSAALFMDAAVVLDPAAFNVHLGASSGVALLRAVADAQAGGEPLANVTGRFPAWSERAGMADHADDYGDLTGRVWPAFGTSSHTQTTDILDALEEPTGSRIPWDEDDPFGGGTSGDLYDWGGKLSRARGEITATPVGPPDAGDWRIESLQVAVEFALDPPLAPEDLLYARSVGLEVTRHGDYVVHAQGIESSLLERDLILSIDARVNPSLPAIEGGLTVRQGGYEAMSFSEFAAALGVGADALYVAARVDAQLSGLPLGPDTRLGGAVIVGRFSTDSPVLEAQFTSHMEDLEERYEVQGERTGVYANVYGDFPLFSAGCFVSVSASASVAFFALVGAQGTDAGGRVVGAIYGELLCAVSGRGQLELQTVAGATASSLSGTGWAAGGIGFCDPENWIDWDDRWWDDGWCWQGGVVLRIGWREGSGWDFDASGDAEGL